MQFFAASFIISHRPGVVANLLVEFWQPKRQYKIGYFHQLWYLMYDYTVG